MRYLFLLAFMALLGGCQKEISGEATSPRNCVACSYLPVCDSSEYRYVDSVAGRVDTLDNQLFILGDTVIRGKKYTEVTGFATFNTGLLANCDGDDYRLLFPLSALGLDVDSLVSELLAGLPVPPGTVTVPQTVTTSVLKANLGVNAQWTDTVYNASIPPFFTLFAGLDYQIVAKNVQRMVFQKNYNNVIQVKSELKLKSPLVTVPLNFVIDYFFARDVGIIEVQVRNGGQLQRVLKLYSYQL